MQLIDRALFASTAIVTISSVCAIVPDLKQRTVVGQQLTHLFAIDLDVFRLSVGRLMPVPRGNIDAEFQTRSGCSLRKLANDVAAAILVGTVSNGMISSFCRPQAEAVVMLCS